MGAAEVIVEEGGPCKQTVGRSAPGNSIPALTNGYGVKHSSKSPRRR